MAKWFPDPTRVEIARNPNYLNSVWTGIVTPIIHMPLMIWYFVLLPAWNGIRYLFHYWLLCIVCGFSGMAIAEKGALPGDRTKKNDLTP